MLKRPTLRRCQPHGTVAGTREAATRVCVDLGRVCAGHFVRTQAVTPVWFTRGSTAVFG